ncbi:MAG TPA: hypothetical protein VMT03_00895 [Polyangia bacterium]|nr:hypothetical protein [Polyangia bacterium]
MSHLRQPELLLAEAIEETVPQPDPPVVIPLGGGRSLEVRPERDAATLRIRAEGDRQLQIEVRFEASGPVLRVEAPQLQVETPRAVSFACETFNVEASRGIDLRSGGDITQTAAGNARVDAQRVDVEASPGAIRLKANDEVQLLGEMILLNSDDPRLAAPMPEWASGPRVAPEVAAAPTSGDPDLVAELLSRARAGGDGSAPEGR